VSTDTADSGQQRGRASGSRRGLLTAAAAALGVVAVETLGSAVPAQASAGNPVLQSTDNGGNTKRTGVFTTGNNEWGVLADPNTSGKGSLGVYGHGQDFGVYADTAGTGTGVYGGGGGDGGTGVYGAGTGTGPGVIGTAPGAGSGVLAENTGTGPALTVSGRAFFSTAGVLTVSAGQSSVTKTGVTLTGSSLLFATLQQNHSGVWVQSAVPDVAGSSFTVHLNKAVAASTTVAWFTIN